MKKGIIILSGGGDIDLSIDVDNKYFSLLNDRAKILYIPIALNRDWKGFESCYDWFADLISKHCIGKEIDFSMILENDEIPDLKDFTSIYIGGGNTYKLLDYIYKKDLKNKIKEFINNGGIFYGGSAGAIILGKDIRTVDEENDRNYKYWEGLNLLNDFSIICHYTDQLDAKVSDFVRKYNVSTFALTEGSGLFIENDKITTIGKIYLFDKDEGCKRLFIRRKE